jgi:hypothetical protein
MSSTLEWARVSSSTVEHGTWRFARDFCGDRLIFLQGSRVR